MPPQWDVYGCIMQGDPDEDDVLKGLQDFMDPDTASVGTAPMEGQELEDFVAPIQQHQQHRQQPKHRRDASRARKSHASQEADVDNQRRGTDGEDAMDVDDNDDNDNDRLLPPSSLGTRAGNYNGQNQQSALKLAHTRVDRDASGSHSLTQRRIGVSANNNAVRQLHSNGSYPGARSASAMRASALAHLRNGDNHHLRTRSAPVNTVAYAYADRNQSAHPQSLKQAKDHQHLHARRHASPLLSTMPKYLPPKSLQSAPTAFKHPRVTSPSPYDTRKRPQRATGILNRLGPPNFNGRHAGCRYFILKSNNADNIAISQHRSVWASKQRNGAMLSAAFQSSRRVLLVFSVNGSRAFQGIAEMESDIGAVEFNQWTDVCDLSGAFRVRWIHANEVAMSAFRHLTNPLNDNLPLFRSRDGQELPCDVGAEIVETFEQLEQVHDDYDEYDDVHYPQYNDEHDVRNQKYNDKHDVHNQQYDGEHDAHIDPETGFVLLPSNDSPVTTPSWEEADECDPVSPGWGWSNHNNNQSLAFGQSQEYGSTWADYESAVDPIVSEPTLVTMQTSPGGRHVPVFAMPPLIPDMQAKSLRSLSTVGLVAKFKQDRALR